MVSICDSLSGMTVLIHGAVIKGLNILICTTREDCLRVWAATGDRSVV